MKLEKNLPLSQITTFQLGGPAQFYLRVSSPEEAVAAVLVAQDKKIKYYLVGGGSNLVFSDQGFSGLVIHWYLDKPKVRDLVLTGQEIIVSSGVPLSLFVRLANSQGLVGVEKLMGIPGTVGGAIVGHAGAYGQTISDQLVWIEIFDGEKVRRLNKKACGFAYRDSLFKHQPWIVLRAGFRFRRGDSRALAKVSREIKKIRWAKFGERPICAGSFFKNVYRAGEIIPTATLIEQAGAVNLRQGGISIASWHHNFLINDGTGTTKDLLKLKNKIKKVIHRKLGIKLEEEVRFVV